MVAFSAPTSAQVVILMCTYNGAAFLKEQLDSLAAQTHSDWRLIVSDDGSRDDTLTILSDYQHRWGANRLEIRQGPRQGFCQNFLSLSCDPTITGPFFAFCDQDDVWLNDKLTTALTHLQGGDPTVPHLYCGRTIYVHDNLKVCGHSPRFLFPETFRNALVQSIAGGNTMVFNEATKHLLEVWGPQSVPSHDWWLYLLVSGVGGEVHYDEHPQVLYRQHPNSLVGGNQSIRANLKRAWGLLRGRFRQWNSQNIAALVRHESHLSEDNRKILKLFIRLRGASLIDRFRLMDVCGLYRQTRMGTVGLQIAALLNRI